MPKVATCILTDKEGKILILKRSDKVKTYKRMWSGVAGYIEENEEPIDTAFKEILEERGIIKEENSLIKRGEPVCFTDIYEKERYDWMVFPFLFMIEKNKKVKIDWEHTEYKWILPSGLNNYDTVPHLKDVVSKLL